MKFCVCRGYLLASFILAVIAVLGGCMTVVSGVATVLSVGVFPDSDYIVFSPTKSAAEEQRRIYEKNQSKVVEDKYGKFYFQILNSAETGVTTVRHDDYDVLKSAFSKGRGLLLPVATIDGGKRLFVNWAETEVLRKKFQENLRLNLMGLELSKKVWGKMAATRSEAVKRGGFLDHNFFVLNNDTYELVFREFESQFDYIVFMQSTEAALNPKSIALRRNHKGDVEPFLVFQFASMEYFRALKQGGSYRFYTLCGIHDSEEAKLAFEITMSNPHPRIRGDSGGGYNKYLINKYHRSIDVCAKGFAAIGMNGYTSSNRLK